MFQVGNYTNFSFTATGQRTISEDQYVFLKNVYDVKEDSNLLQMTNRVGLGVESVAEQNQQAISQVAATSVSHAALMNTYFAIGSANAQWKPLAAIGDYYTDRMYIQNDQQIANNLTGNQNVYYVIDLPPTKGTLKLYINSVRFTLADADANNYVNSTNILEDGSQTELDAGNDTTVDDFQHDFTARDLSSILSAWIRIITSCANGAGFGIRGLSVRYYYDD